MPFQPDEMTLSTLKGFVDRLARFHKNQPQPSTWPPKRAWCQEAIAQALGFPTFHAAHTAIGSPRIPTTSPFWRLPVKDTDALNPSLARLGQQGESSLLIPHTTLLSHMVLFGSEAVRKPVLEDLNKQSPCFWIQGPLSLAPKVMENSLLVEPYLGWNSLLTTVLPSAPAGELIELMVSLMDEMGGDNAMWKGRAISLLSSVMMALVYLRDNTDFDLDMETIREHLALAGVQRLAKRRDLPPNVSQSLRAYLRALPGFDEQAYQQSDTAMEQHGFLQMQFTQVLTVLPGRTLNLNPRMHIRMRSNTAKSITGLSLLLRDWMEREGFGVLVIDGMNADSSVFAWVVKHMASLTEHGKAVLIATGGLSELPEGHERHRLMGRIDSVACLGLSEEMTRVRQNLGLKERSQGLATDLKKSYQSD